MFSKTTHRSIIFHVIFAGIIIGLVFLAIHGLEASVGSHRGTHGDVTALRLQVIPHSNRPSDQDLKLIIRGEVLSLLREEIQSPPSSAEAMVDAVAERLPLVQERVETVLDAAGVSLPFEVRLEEVSDATSFGERFGGAWGSDDEAVVLRIVLGEGRGNNFWCVIFPNMCFVSDSVEEYFPLASSGNVVEAAEADPEPMDLVVVDQTREPAVQVEAAGNEAGNEPGKIEIRWKLWEQIERSRASRMIRGFWENTVASIFTRD